MGEEAGAGVAVGEAGVGDGEIEVVGGIGGGGSGLVESKCLGVILAGGGDFTAAAEHGGRGHVEGGEAGADEGVLGVAGEELLAELLGGAVAGEGGGGIFGVFVEGADAVVEGEALEGGFALEGIGGEGLIEEGEGFLVAGEGLGGLAEVGTHDVALDIADALVGGGEFDLLFAGGAGFLGEVIEVFETGGNDEFAGFGGAGEGLDGIVDIEDEGMGELADHGEVLFGEAGLAPGEEGGGEERDGDEGGGEGEALAAAEELGGAVAPGVGAGEDGLVGEVAADVLRELFHGLVAAGGIFVEAAEEDGFQVAGEGGVVVAGGEDVLFADALFDAAEGVVGDAVGAVGGEEFVEDGGGGIDVGGDGDGVAADLFGAGVVGGEGWGERGESFGVLGFGIGSVEEFADAEVEEFDDAGLVDEDVAGFEVAVDDELAVGVGDGGADVEEEAEALGGGETVVLAVVGEAEAVDVFHDDVGVAVGGVAAVEEAGDVGVLEAGEGLAFAEEAVEDEVGVEAAADEFDGDLGVVVVVVAFGEVDGAHATAAEFAEDAVGAGAFGEGGGEVVLENGLEGGGEAFFEEAGLDLVVAGEQGGEFGEEGGVVSAGGGEEGGALVRGDVEGGVEEVFDLLPAVGGHGGYPGFCYRAR